LANPEFRLNKDKLSTVNHDRDSAALRYVYPVISRRANGVSVGINLNPNNACNWRCIYCQVPDLKRGPAPTTDLSVLEKELRDFLNELLHGDFMQSHVPEGARRINDIALSGNGEPTSSAQFVQVIALIARVRREVALPETVKTVLITNGSLLYRGEVQQGLHDMAGLNGEVWFKLDRASEDGMRLVNNVRISMNKVRDNLVASMTTTSSSFHCFYATDTDRRASCSIVWRVLRCRQKHRACPHCLRNNCRISRIASASSACRSKSAPDCIVRRFQLSSV
jgi:uncharacterized Fe-S radical SAM superfamily protein PflX